MKSAKVPPAPFFNSRKRLRQAVVADPNENFQDEDDSWMETFAGGRSDLMNNNERDRFPDQCKPFPQSISSNGNRNLYETGHQPSSFQSINTTATSYTKPSIEKNIPGSKISGPVKRGQYHHHQQQQNNTNNVGMMKRKSMERAPPPPVTPTASNIKYSPRPQTTDSSTRSNYNWSFSAQSCKSVSSPQMFGGESFIQEANMAEVAPTLNNRQTNESKHSPNYSQTNTLSKANASGVATTPPNKKERPTEKTPSPINPIFTTFIKDLKNNHLKYKEKFHIICEVYGVLDSAILPDRNLSGRQFLLRDNSDSIECVFYEIDRMLPRLTRGHWLRCIGMVDNKTKRLHCISVRPATLEERNLPRIMALLQQNYLNGLDDDNSQTSISY